MASSIVMAATESSVPTPEPPDNNVGPALVISSSTLMSLVVVTTVLRLLVRVRNRMVGWDDLTIACVAILSAARLGCQIAQVRHGDGRHRAYINSSDYEAANRLGWYALLLFFMAICFMKISVCLLLLRIKNERWLRWLIYGVMAGLVVTNGGVVVILLAECRPVDEYWDDIGSCWDPRVRVFSIYLAIAYQILTDLLCSCLPLVVIWKVRIPLKSKLLVCGLMSLGLFATSCGIGRAASLSLATNDFTWAFCITEIWANCELFVGTIAANLALSRSIYIYLFEDTSLLQGGNGGGANGGNGGGGLVNGGGPSSRSIHRLSLYGYHRHGLTFLNNIRLPWSWNIRSHRRNFDRYHVFRRQSSFSPSRNPGETLAYNNNTSSSSASGSRTVTMETTTTALEGGTPTSTRTKLLQKLSAPLRRIISVLAHRSSSTSISVPGTTVKGEKFRKVGKEVVGISPAGSQDGSVAIFDGVVVPRDEAGGRRGSITSTVVIVGGRSRALDRDREQVHTRNGRSISSSTTVTSQRRSSIYYHHHLSKQHPYGSGSAGKPWPASSITIAEAASASNDSGLSAGPGVIKKRTEFWISEEELGQADYDDEEQYAEGSDLGRQKADASTAAGDACGNDKANEAKRALEFVASSATASLSGRQSISDTSMTTAVDMGVERDGSSGSGGSSNSGSSIN
ncbi:hypothetical protein SCUCBS95973_003523 [Sporothrix curviconia]|uniref:Rhodopsin domain-containing protein n=1 Tax=Sporothrix curviconia TaxID=1260050 RepID=A0ABP0BH72_9PEZI